MDYGACFRYFGLMLHRRWVDNPQRCSHFNRHVDTFGSGTGSYKDIEMCDGKLRAGAKAFGERGEMEKEVGT